MAKNKYKAELYQVFYEGENLRLEVKNYKSLKRAETFYKKVDGFLLLAVDAPTAFDVVYARPYGMALIS